MIQCGGDYDNELSAIACIPWFRNLIYPLRNPRNDNDDDDHHDHDHDDYNDNYLYNHHDNVNDNFKDNTMMIMIHDHNWS